MILIRAGSAGLRCPAVYSAEQGNTCGAETQAPGSRGQQDRTGGDLQSQGPAHLHEAVKMMGGGQGRPWRRVWGLQAAGSSPVAAWPPVCPPIISLLQEPWSRIPNLIGTARGSQTCTGFYGCSIPESSVPLLGPGPSLEDNPGGDQETMAVTMHSCGLCSQGGC